ncbi:MAG: MaoC family dehydratase [Alphaproteobacteria bacterium]|nr:MaoC family dehydratase [Alphaproteobacteria bacterium]
MTTRYFEDWQVGDSFETRGITITESQIVDFALLYDPQSMHIDKTFAAEGMFGELIASGFHTLSISFRLFYDMGYVVHSNIIGLGLDDVRWTAPVRAGDTLRCRVAITALTPSRSKPDRGTMSFKATTLNQRDEEVLHYSSTCILRNRPEE